MAQPPSSGFESAEIVEESDGRQYHIGLAPGEVASSLVLVGDPARAERCAQYFDSREPAINQREYRTITGLYKGLRVSLMATGIGCDNTEIAVVELANLLPKATMIRAGTCGALCDDIQLGDLVVTWGAVRMESTSTYFVPEGYPAVSDPDVVQALRREATEAGVPHHFGMTATAAGFYGAQGRSGRHFQPRNPNITDELAAIGVKNLEMETSTLLTLASLAGFQAGAVCTAFASRTRNEFVDPSRKIEFEDRAVLCALGALVRLSNAAS